MIHLKQSLTKNYFRSSRQFPIFPQAGVPPQFSQVPPRQPFFSQLPPRQPLFPVSSLQPLHQPVFNQPPLHQFPLRQHIPQSFQKPAKPSFPKKPVSKPSLPEPQDEPRKSEQLVSNKQEVNNFGFPSSFGKPGVDFPMYDVNKMPESEFRCEGLVNGGLYADVSAQCQMYHMCVSLGVSGMVRHSFLCPNGTLFSQVTIYLCSLKSEYCLYPSPKAHSKVQLKSKVQV